MQQTISCLHFGKTLLEARYEALEKEYDSYQQKVGAKPWSKPCSTSVAGRKPAPRQVDTDYGHSDLPKGRPQEHQALEKERLLKRQVQDRDSAIEQLKKDLSMLKRESSMQTQQHSREMEQRAVRRLDLKERKINQLEKELEQEREMAKSVLMKNEQMELELQRKVQGMQLTPNERQQAHEWRLTVRRRIDCSALTLRSMVDRATEPDHTRSYGDGRSEILRMRQAERSHDRSE